MKLTVLTACAPLTPQDGEDDGQLADCAVVQCLTIEEEHWELDVKDIRVKHPDDSAGCVAGCKAIPANPTRQPEAGGVAGSRVVGP